VQFWLSRVEQNLKHHRGYQSVRLQHVNSWCMPNFLLYVKNWKVVYVSTIFWYHCCHASNLYLVSCHQNHVFYFNNIICDRWFFKITKTYKPFWLFNLCCPEFHRSVNMGNILVGERIPESGLGGAARTEEASATTWETCMFPGAGAVSKNLGCWALFGLRMVRKRGRKMCFWVDCCTGTWLCLFFHF